MLIFILFTIWFVLLAILFPVFFQCVKGLLDYAILWEISLLSKKNCTESCKQEQYFQPDVVGFLLRATFLPSDCSTFIEGGCGTLSIRLLSFFKGSIHYLNSCLFCSVYKVVISIGTSNTVWSKPFIIFFATLNKLDNIILHKWHKQTKLIQY